MKGWQIFWQSVLRVFNNLGPALRVSAVPYLIIAAVFAVLLLPVMGLIMDRQAMQAAIQSGAFPWINFIVVVVVGIVGTLWIAVAWHRYILADEVPGLVPPFRFDRILSYFLRILLIVVILLVIGIVLGLLASLIVGAVVRPTSQTMVLVAAFLLALIVGLPLYVIGLRLSTSLPGAALGAAKGIGDGWRATAGQLGTLVVLAIILTVANFLSEYVSGLLSGNSVLFLIWTIVVGWVSAMIGLSILTTLYGHYVEGRPLE